MNNLRPAVQSSIGGPLLVVHPIGVPDSSSPYNQGVGVFSGFFGSDQVGGLWVTCSETGVTLQRNCTGGGPFYHTSTGTKHYSTPGGPGITCDIPTAHNYSGGSKAGMVPGPDLILEVTQL